MPLSSILISTLSDYLHRYYMFMRTYIEMDLTFDVNLFLLLATHNVPLNLVYSVGR